MSTLLRKRFGQRIKELRKAAGMSQEAFADRCGFARSYMSRVERGAGNPSLDAIEVLAEGLGVRVAELFEPTTTPPTKPKKKLVKVPFAADGTCFNPSLTRPKVGGGYTVGEKGAEISIKSFKTALEYLKQMKAAHWRRPNKAGNWGIVAAVRWGSLPDEFKPLLQAERPSRKSKS